ncbi:hypothetical protein IG631_23705 [Alternaria alternata]|nr:hypothetical protein IG631_23705 [Alternaria alternata]
MHASQLQRHKLDSGLSPVGHISLSCARTRLQGPTSDTSHSTKHQHRSSHRSLSCNRSSGPGFKQVSTTRRDRCSSEGLDGSAFHISSSFYLSQCSSPSLPRYSATCNHYSYNRQW